MAHNPEIDLGFFAAGEIPPDLRHQFLDFNGDPVDLTGFTTLSMQVEVHPVGTGPYGDGPKILTTPAQGIVTYSWSATDMAEPGSYRAQLWASDGTKRYASDVIIYTVYDGPGVAP